MDKVNHMRRLLDTETIYCQQYQGYGMIIQQKLSVNKDQLERNG